MALPRHHERHLQHAKLLFGLIVLLILSSTTWFLFARNYPEFYKHFIVLVHKPGAIILAKHPALLAGFYICRTIALVVLSWFAYRLYRYSKDRSPLIHRNENIVFVGVINSLRNNLCYIRSLRQYRYLLGLLMVLQLSFFVYFLETIPFHFDESFSYLTFSGRGLLSSITYYPVPNNHVLYNAIASIAMKLPVAADPMNIARCVNVFISVITTYYLFKTANVLFSLAVSIIVTACCIYSFPFLLYGFEARGYTLLFFFAVTSIYSFLQIVKGYKTTKYLALHCTSFALGLFTMPSFLYVGVPVSTLILIQSFIAKDIKLLRSCLVAHLIMAINVVALYTPIIIFNGIDFLAKAQKNGISEVQDYAYIKANIFRHFSDSWHFLLAGIELSILWLIPFFGILAFISAKATVPKRYLAVLVLMLFASAIPIVFLQQIIPFSRTWSYLVIPVALGLGLILDFLSEHYRIQARSSTVYVLACFAIIWSAVWVSKTLSFHSSTNDVDYKVAEINRLLQPQLASIQSIDRANDFSWYLAEQVEAEILKHGRSIVLRSLNDSTPISADMVVVGSSTSIDLPAGYSLFPYDNVYFKVYLRHRTSQILIDHSQHQ